MSTAGSSCVSLWKPLVWCLCAFSVFSFSQGASSTSKDHQQPARNGHTSRSGSPPSANREHAPGRVCTTNACKKTAKKFTDAIDPTADPCTDFYQYACGKWNANAKIPDDEISVSHFTILTNDSLQNKIKMFAKPAKNPPASERKAREIYQQCLNTEQIENLRSEPVIQQLQRYIGGWPLITPDWNPDDFNAYSALVELMLIGTQPFAVLGIGATRNDTSKNVLEVDEPSTFTSVDILNSTDGNRYTEAYFTLMSNVTAQLVKDAQLESDIPYDELTEILETEKRLTNVPRLSLFSATRYRLALPQVRQTAQETRDDTVVPFIVSLEELQSNFTFRSAFFKNFTQFVREVFGAANLESTITNDTSVWILNTDLLDAADKLYFEYEVAGNQGKRKMANYIGWQFIAQWSSMLSSDYFSMLEEYSKVLYGQTTRKETPRSETCVGHITEIMPLAAGAMYVRDFVPKKTHEKIVAMVGQIKQRFREMIESAVWMDKQTQSKAIKKLNSILLMAAYPDTMTSGLREIDEYYKNITLEPTYFETYLTFIKGSVIRSLERYTRFNPRYDPFLDTVDVTSVRAGNLLTSNMIQITSAILQPPFFDAAGPQFMNYGGIGYAVGHETTHGFDNTGANYDEKGNRRSWWTPRTYLLFDDRTRRMSWQYGNYSTPIGTLNGVMTLGENIADNGGLKVAYRAYMNASSAGTADPMLPGLESFSAQQLFFLSAAQVWCSKMRPEVERELFWTDEHAPVKYRVNGPVSNLLEFSQAFGCPSGSLMNPSVKNVVW